MPKKRRKRAYKKRPYDPQRRKRYDLALHGITPELFEAMLKEQDYRCAMCREPFDLDSLTPNVDHDHAHCPGVFGCPLCIRGLLHHKCNKMLGFADDSMLRLQLAINYLGKARPDALKDVREQWQQRIEREPHI